MKLVKASFVLALILAWTMASGSVLAWGGKGRSVGGGRALPGGFRSSPSTPFRVFVGGSFFWPGYYYPPYYSYPPYGYYPADYSPVVEYVEAGSTQPAPEESEAYWYYCADAKTYYPYVEQCPAGWQEVVPQASPG
jgi:hypothetical protein